MTKWLPESPLVRLGVDDPEGYVVIHIDTAVLAQAPLFAPCERVGPETITWQGRHAIDGSPVFSDAVGRETLQLMLTATLQEADEHRAES